MIAWIEIDENLCRAELTPAQRAYAIKRRKEIWEMRSGESGQSSATFPKTGRGNTQFAADTAEATGQSKSSINQHVARAEALGDFVEQYAHAREASPLPDVNPQAGGAGGKPCSAAESHHLLDLMQNTR